MWSETDEEYWHNTMDMRIDIKVRTGVASNWCETRGEYLETSSEVTDAKSIGFEIGYELGTVAESLIEKLCGFRSDGYREAARQFADMMECAADALDKATAKVMEGIADEKA